MKLMGRWSSVLLASVCGVLVTVPAIAQVDLSGYWRALYTQDWQLRLPGPDPVDYTGLPINAAARAVALSYSDEQLSLPEEQCIVYAPTYALYGPGMFTMWADFDKKSGEVVAWNTGPSLGDQPGLKIWMDGRPQPSRLAINDSRGFTTGRWEGDELVTYTTHMKWWLLRKNGVPLSDKASMALRWIMHGNLLTTVAQIDDPVYLTEPYIYTRVLIKDAETNLNVNGFPGGTSCSPAVEVAEFAKIGRVPNYLPARNPTINVVTQMRGIPQFAVLGGAETMYPEFQQRLKGRYVAPAKCEQNCCGWNLGGASIRTLKQCPTFVPGPTPANPPPFPAPVTP
jgi:hypothetical protein